MLPNSASPFSFQKKNSPFNKGKQKANDPPEEVTLVVCKFKVVTALIPFGTKQAKNIREHMHANITSDDGMRYFIFRNENGWTNIDLRSTAEEPKLTGEPVDVLKKAHEEFTKCQHVSKVIVKWDSGEPIDAPMEFDCLPDRFTDPPADNNDDDNDDGSTVSVSEKVDNLGTQLAHVITQVDSLFAHFDKYARAQGAMFTAINRAGLFPPNTCDSAAGSSNDAEREMVMYDEAELPPKTPERTVEKPDGTPSTETGKKRKARAAK